MRSLHRGLAAAAVVPLMVFSLVACGSNDDKAGSSSSDDKITSVSGSESTPSEDGNQAGTTIDGDATGEEIDAKAFAKKIEAGFANIDTASMDMEITGTGTSMTATGQVDYSGDSPKMAMEMSSDAFGDQPISARVIDGVMYMSMPMLGEDSFFKIDLEDPTNPLAGNMGGLSTFDPLSTVDMFSQGLEKVNEVGDESVDGVPTTHYVLTTSTDSFKDSLGDEAASVPDTLEYDVWLDEQDRPAKMEADLEEQGTMTLTLSKFGEPVSITAPPADQIQEFPEIPDMTAKP